MSKVSKQRILEVVEQVLGSNSSVEIALDDPALVEIAEQVRKSRVRLDLSMQGISVEVPKSGTTVTFRKIGAIGTPPKSSESATKPKSRPAPKRHQHTYRPPEIAKEVMDYLIDDASCNIMFGGPKGTGKSTCARYLTKELGMKLYQVNCHPNMTEEEFFGEKEVVLNENTKDLQNFLKEIDFSYLDNVKLGWLKPLFYMLAQLVRLIIGATNHIVYKDGPAVLAMQEGLDEDGNEVGPGAILFIDEAASMPSSSIVLNRLLECDDPRRTITLARDGGRVVRSHSKFRIILAGNTFGSGAMTEEQSQYTAQLEALDGSLRDRINYMFEFDYDEDVEKHICMEKLGDDKIVQQVLKFRDAIRDNISAGRLCSMLTTRKIIDICNAYRVSGNLGKAIYRTLFGQLEPEEKPIVNEIAQAQLGVDIMAMFK